MRSRLVPESKFDPIPESRLVIDFAKVVFYDMLSRADGVGDFTVLQSLRDEFDNSQFSFARKAVSVTVSTVHIVSPRCLACNDRFVRNGLVGAVSALPNMFTTAAMDGLRRPPLG